MRTHPPPVVPAAIRVENIPMPTQPTTTRFVRHTFPILAATTVLIALSGCASYQHTPEAYTHTTTPTQSLVSSTSKADELNELWLAWWPQASIHETSTDSLA
ncbi:MAG: hypothetical protein JKY96_05990, partial [Phycisphaerales bacterium]|nr:hypothetical protein [Phycisphaerales bacterium]